ncbi:hypothetical protein [Priestia endophytica]|uniref:hypothetical protein n=1 Tax=Priestia endophytica TaxID=135735 RepID=UPI000DCA8D1B|nr:hypothetical protein [Priestia endophytica]RAS76281.1 hypothetical protein A4R27_21375 [Priestia endophytica]
MSIHHRRSSKRNRPSVEKEAENSLSSFLKDASLIILILTGLTYLLGFSFKQGYLDYYEINDLMLNNIEISYIATPFISSLSFITEVILMYLLLHFLFSSAKEEGFIYHYWVKTILFLFLATGLLKFALNKELSETGYDFVFNTVVIIGAIVLIDWVLNYKSNSYKKFVKPVKKRLFSLILFFRVDKRLKYIFFIPFIMLSSLILYGHGKTVAAQEEKYLIIENKSVDLAIIIQGGDNLLVAPVDLNKKIITPDFRVIEAKSTLDKQMVFKSVHIKNGLKVKKPESY